ncbi:MAG: response regulator transcription factor [Deltaproteobacteria bacterium]|nr:response regulator transcription factor [Deltaproteobacteria bacterium]
MASVIIADDHVVLRQGLRALLSSLENVEVVAEAGDGFEVVSLVQRYMPDILILDLSMPNLGGMEAISRLRKLKNDTKILVLSAHDDDSSVRAVMRAGANGFVPKTAKSSELEFAITAVLAGKNYLSPSVCSSILGFGINSREEDCSPLAVLTDREREVMKLLSEGERNKAIAKKLHISPRTVDSHRANIMKKLSANSNAELVHIALKHGLID